MDDLKAQYSAISSAKKVMYQKQNYSDNVFGIRQN